MVTHGHEARSQWQWVNELLGFVWGNVPWGFGYQRDVIKVSCVLHGVFPIVLVRHFATLN